MKKTFLCLLVCMTALLLALRCDLLPLLMNHCSIQVYKQNIPCVAKISKARNSTFVTLLFVCLSVCLSLLLSFSLSLVVC